MRREHVLALCAVVVWGSFTPISKLALLELSPGWLTVARMALGFSTLAALCLASGALAGLRAAPRADLARLVLIGVCGNFVSPYLVTLGLNELSASVGSLLANTSPLIVALVAPLLIGERLGRWTVVGLVAGLLGVATLLLPGADPSGAESISTVGVGFTLLGSTGWSLYIVLGRSLLARYHPFAVAMLAAGSGLPLLLVAALLEGGAAAAFERLPAYLPHLIWLGVVSTGLGFGVWMIALRGMRAAALTAFQYLIPAFGVVFSYLILGERPTPIFLLGGALVLLGVATAQVRR